MYFTKSILILLLLLSASLCLLAHAAKKPHALSSLRAESPAAPLIARADWKPYQFPASGLSFQYPPSLIVVASDASTDADLRVIAASLETPAYAAAIKTGVSVEHLPFLVIGAYISKSKEIVNQCGGSSVENAVVQIAGEPVRECVSLTLGQFHHLGMSFRVGSTYSYFVESDDYADPDRPVIDRIIATLKIEQ